MKGKHSEWMKIRMDEVFTHGGQAEYEKKHKILPRISYKEIYMLLVKPEQRNEIYIS